MNIRASDILTVTTAVTREWEKQRKAEERGRRSRASRAYMYSDRVNFTDVANRIIPDAYQHASGGGQYPTSKRQLYYACREAFKQETGRELDAQYFSNTLLVQYLNRHKHETAAWKITADPRGTLTIPNAGYDIRIPCGTLQIDDHLEHARSKVEALDIDHGIDVEWPSVAAGQRYQGVMYIEKEGFGPLMEQAEIAERFDLAILSCKGQSVVAARRFIDEVCAVGSGVPLFVVHDFDKAGFEISQRLTQVSDWAEENDRVTYQFKNEINVIDLGLRLTDVQQYGLAEETCEFKGRFARDSICTDEEKLFLQSGRRVELNAFTSPQFIEWLESKLTEHGLGERLVPDDDVLAKAYRRALAVAEINSRLEEIAKDAMDVAEKAKIPKGLRSQLLKQMEDDPQAWDKALYAIAKTKFLEQRASDAFLHFCGLPLSPHPITPPHRKDHHRMAVFTGEKFAIRVNNIVAVVAAEDNKLWLLWNSGQYKHIECSSPKERDQLLAVLAAAMREIDAKKGK